MAEDYMDEFVDPPAASDHSENEDHDGSNPLSELERYFSRPRVSHEHCPDVIKFWGVHHFLKSR